ncbi:MAG: Panacea domain-containing protein [Solirubrobacteraceae bacterium]|jgi:hypothetical protein
MPAEIDKAKLHELIVLIAARMEADDQPGRGRIKLAKLLWLSDFEAHRRLGRSITGERYIADELGPAPADEMLALRDLEAAGDLVIERGYGKQQLIHATRPADLSRFTEGEGTVIEETLSHYRNWTGSQLVELAHEYPGWKLAQRGSEIPYHSVHVSAKGPTERDIERARELARDIPV